MGNFFEDLLRERIHKMSNDEVIANWKRCCSNVTGKRYVELLEENPSTKPEWFWYEYEVQRRRIAYKYNIVTLEKKKWEYLAELHRKEREAQEKEEELRKTEEFMEILSNSEMAQILEERINALGYDAYYICISMAEVTIHKSIGQDEEGTKIQQVDRIRYFDFNYPNLENFQINALKKYMQDQLQLNYEIVENGLILKDPDPRMRTSW